MLPTGRKGIGSVSWRATHRFLSVVTALAMAGCGTAAAQDFSAGKTAPQLFASDCSACHKSPGGLAKGRDSRSLTSFLREHYTTKEESAAALAAYLAGAPGGAAEAKPKPQAPAAATAPNGPKPKTAARGENEPEARPETRERPKPRANAESEAKPEAKQEGEGDTGIMREERRPPREATREPDPTVGKLKLYGAAGTGAREIERSADKSHKVESYVNSGSPPEAAAPTDTGSTNAAAAPGADDAHAAKRKKKDAAAPPASDTTAHAPRPRRAQAPVIQPVPGNN
jgi:hypothetical protein